MDKCVWVPWAPSEEPYKIHLEINHLNIRRGRIYTPAPAPMGHVFSCGLVTSVSFQGCTCVRMDEACVSAPKMPPQKVGGIRSL